MVRRSISLRKQPFPWEHSYLRREPRVSADVPRGAGGKVARSAALSMQRCEQPCDDQLAWDEHT